MAAAGKDRDAVGAWQTALIGEDAARELRDRDAELARSRDYAARYEAARAPQAAVVRGWRKALGIR